MKSIFSKILIFGLITTTIWSCKKDEVQTVTNVSPAGTLTASATALNLIQANQTRPALTLSFPAPTVTGYIVPVSNTLQFDLKGKNFSTAREVVVSNASYTPTVSEFNTMLLALGGVIGTSTQVEVRLKSGPAVNAMTYSNVITLTATPYLASAWIYAPGAYQVSPDWNPPTADSLVSLTSNGIYKGVINYPTGKLEFKITPEKKWDVNYGDGGSGTLNSTGGNLNAGTAGLKQVTVDMNAKTWSIKPVLQLWSIIGDATPGGWGTDTDMKYINDGKESWRITLDLKAGPLKFRMNHDWAVNLGGGTNLTLGGADINVATAGNYTITLSVNNPDPTLAATSVIGGTYTIVKN
ncbi:hypothetical protein QF042_005029 [Pedobacter sp. W3I1]|uniref:SusE domain-containing protein n=1 Tax=Pedobacter sp. W3I1 TaxID=3042291 RepID=UPI00278B6312|nr:SusE domain-containing protein [Pedobacter sp. W3I1]MDQ0641464.1 hypothetical protein [Pedobacter sp. W3I1]